VFKKGVPFQRVLDNFFEKIFEVNLFLCSGELVALFSGECLFSGKSVDEVQK